MTELLEALRSNQSLLREIALQYGTARNGKAAAGGPHNPEAVAELCADMVSMVQEQVRVLTVNTKHELIEAVTVYQGTVNTASTRGSEILRPAIIANTPCMIVVHNHPSGDPEPSPEDLRFTRKLLRAAEYMDITISDHVIVARDGFCSMAGRKIGGFEHVPLAANLAPLSG